MLILPGAMHASPRKNIMTSLPSLLACYDSVLSQPVVQPDGKINSISDLSGNGHHLRVKTEGGKVHPTYGSNIFGVMPGIQNLLDNEKVELSGDTDVGPITPEQQTWFMVYKAYELKGRRILSLGDNYHTPMDHYLGLMWGRNEDTYFPRTNISLLPGAVVTFIFNSTTELIIRGNGQQALDSLGNPYNIDPLNHYSLDTSYNRYITLFTGWDIVAPLGAFGAVAFCMEALPLLLIEKVERYLSQRFSIPLSV